MSKSSKSSLPTPRLDQLLAGMGYGSRREIKQFAKMGLIKLDDEPLISAEDRITLTPDLPTRLSVDDEDIDPLPGMVVMLHKPLGVTCSHKEKGKLVYELFPARWRHRDPPLSTIGRLDKETSGLLLLTDDGHFLHQTISPRHHIPKRYLVSLAASMRGNEREVFAAGTLLLEGEEKPLLPAALEVLSPTTAYLTITEGRYHQVRRMFAAMNNEVTTLHRDRIGDLELPEPLKPGAYRLLTRIEIDQIGSVKAP